MSIRVSNLYLLNHYIEEVIWRGGTSQKAEIWTPPYYTSKNILPQKPKGLCKMYLVIPLRYVKVSTQKKWVWILAWNSLKKCFIYIITSADCREGVATILHTTLFDGNRSMKLIEICLMK